MNYFEARLMVLSQNVAPKVFRMVSKSTWMQKKKEL